MNEKSVLIANVYMDLFRGKDRLSLYRHMYVVIKKQLKDQYGYILDSDKRSRIANIISVKYTNLLYNYSIENKDLNHISLMISIDLQNNSYEVIEAFNEHLSFKTKYRDRFK